MRLLSKCVYTFAFGLVSLISFPNFAALMRLNKLRCRHTFSLSCTGNWMRSPLYVQRTTNKISKNKTKNADEFGWTKFKSKDLNAYGPNTKVYKLWRFTFCSFWIAWCVVHSPLNRMRIYSMCSMCQVNVRNAYIYHQNVFEFYQILCEEWRAIHSIRFYESTIGGSVVLFR